MSLETREISFEEIEKIINYFKFYANIKVVPVMALQSFLSRISQEGISILAFSRLLSEKLPKLGDIFEIQARLQKYASPDQQRKNFEEGLMFNIRQEFNELGNIAANERAKEPEEREGA